MAESFPVTLDQAISRLRDAGVASPEADAWSLIAGVTGLGRGVRAGDVWVLDGTGHFIFDEKPDEAAAAVAGFLGRVRA